jgi:TRAP-type C4-dicarboxylate transport system substrate-binding protein
MVGQKAFLVSLALVSAVAVAPARAVVFKIATLAPDGSTWMEAAAKGAAEVARRTEGRVTFRFYPGGSMGNDQAVLRKMRIGQLQGGALTIGALADVYPDAQIYGLPLLFGSYAEVDAVRSRVDGTIVNGLAEHGLISFGLIEGGFAYLMSDKPTRSFADLKDRKVWLPEGDVIGAAILAAAGVSPVPLPLSDVLTGLQTGLIDTVAGSPVGAVVLQWFTKIKYLTDVPLIYIYGTMVVDRTSFERLSAADRAVVREVMGGVMKELDGRTRKDNEEAKEALRKEGIEFIEVTPEAHAQWEQVAARATATLGKNGVYTQSMYDEVHRVLAAFRSAQGAKN